MDYPMFALARVICQNEVREIEEKMKNLDYKRAQYQAAWEELKATRAGSIVVQEARLGENQIHERYQVQVVFCPEMLYRAGRGGSGWGNVDLILHDTARIIAQQALEAMRDFAKKRGLTVSG